MGNLRERRGGKNEGDQTAPPDPSRSLRAALVLAALVLAALAVLLFGVAMRRDLNHDEHQFLAAGALSAREGLWPYRDFAWFHMPALAWLNAALFRLADPLLLSARLLNIAAATGTFALLMGTAFARLRRISPARRPAAGAAAVLLLAASPAFLHASGRAWNHDLPIFLSLAAFLLLLWGLEHGPGRDGHAAAGSAAAGSAAAGLLLGLAIAVRLSYAPLALPFLLAPLLWNVRGRRFLWSALAFAAGMAVGLLPALWGFATAPDAFLFGNLTYARLNTAWYRAAAGAEAASLARKAADTLRFVLLQPGNALLLAAALLALLRVRPSLRRAPELLFWLLLWPFLLLGALAPTPMQMQYVYLFFPFLALGLLLALAHDPAPRRALAGVGAAAIVAVALALPAWGAGAAVLFAPDEWYPRKVHARGQAVADLVLSGPQGDVISLAPTLALEGGLPIAPFTATGPFAWRVAPLLAPEERARFGLVGPDDLAAALEAAPPRALFTGAHMDDADAEAALSGWAQAHGFVPVPIQEEGTLWLSPVAEWGGALRLGGHNFPTRPLAPGDAFVATLHVQATAPLTANLNILVRGVDTAGNELLRAEGWPYGSPTSTWQVGDVWPHGLEVQLPGDAAPGLYRVEVSFYDPETLAPLGDAQPVAWLTVGAAAVPPGAQAVPFADGITLLDSAAEPLAAAQRLDLPLFWQATARPARDYTLFAHLVDAGGAVVAQADRPPLGGFFPTSHWRPGLLLEDRIVLELPPDLPPGRYGLLVGLYDPVTLQRLPLTGGGDAHRYADVE